MNGSNSKQKLTTFGLVAIIALLGLNAFLLYNKYQQDKTIRKQEAELDESEKLRAELEKQYYDAMSQLESSKGENQQLNELIEKQKAELTDSKNRISALLTNKKDLDKARAQIKDLVAQRDQYLAEINNLRQQNEQLQGENQTLVQEKQVLTTNIEKERTEKDELARSKAQLMTEKQTVESDRNVLSNKLTKVSVVSVSKVDVQGYESKSTGKSVKRNYARNVDKIRICFEAGANAATEPGTEKFFVRVIQPEGSTLAVQNAGSGTLKRSDTGEQVEYSFIGEHSYNNKAGEVCLDWSPGVTLQAGTYTVEVYNKGYLAGNGSFRLK